MQKLSNDTIRSVCSGQVITSPYSIVKELVENSLDAGSSIIEIRTEEYGLNKIEIRDNGTGIKEHDRSSVALPHYTSKLKNFADISYVSTYGYRGEALSAICSVAKVNMVTRHSSDNTAKSYSFDKDGVIKELGSSHQNIGTTVTVTDLFKNLPVRKKFYQGKKGKEQLMQIEDFTKGIALANPSVRLMVRHNKHLVWQHASTKQLKDAIAGVYGSIGDIVTFSYCGEKESEISITGMLSATAKSAKKPPFIIINKRLVKCKPLLKILKKLYDGSFPSGVICISLNSSFVDVNVEVDKSSVICRNEEEIISIVEELVRTQVLHLPASLNSADQTQDFYEQNLTTSTQISTEALHSDSIIEEKGNTGAVPNGHPPSILPNKPFSKLANTSTYRQSHLSCTPDILGGPLGNLPEESGILDLHQLDQMPRTAPVYSDDEQDELPTQANLSLWDELEKDLESQELFSPTEKEPITTNFDPHSGVGSLLSDSDNPGIQKLENLIDLPGKNETESKPDKTSKQSSIISWSQGNSEFKMEFISPEQIMKQAVKNVNCAKKRDKSISPMGSEKRRKLSTPSPKSKPPLKSKFTFNLHYLKEALLFEKRTIIHDVQTLPKALKCSKGWLIIWENTLFAFNPTRAQEVNLYRKLMCSHSLKYGPTLPLQDPSFDLRPSNLSLELYSYLTSCPTTPDPMGEYSHVTDKALAINGIRINKVNEGLFRVTNICDDVPGFDRVDVIETLELIIKRSSEKDNTDNDEEISVCDYSSVRCGKIIEYLKGKAAKVSKTFAAFEPTATDVMDLFSNSQQIESCVHGEKFKEVLWEF